MVGELRGNELVWRVDRGIGSVIVKDDGDMSVEFVDNRDERIVDVVSTDIRSDRNPASLEFVKKFVCPEAEVFRMTPEVGVLMKLTLG